ncbi:MAG: cyclophilin-like fold protein [Nitrososphaerales archaeon]
MTIHEIIIDFVELKERVSVQLNEESSPVTVRAILEKLPLEVIMNRWGDELYTEPMPVKVGEENAKSRVNVMDVAYWPEGSALCLFFGPTPISKGNEIRPYSPVNVIGKIVSKDNMARRVSNSTKAIIRK